MPGPVFFEGDKINLRTIEEEDIGFLRNGVNHPQVRKFMGNRKPQNLHTEQEFFDNVICGDENTSLLICQDNKSVGIISVIQEESKAQKLGELGLWIRPDHHGKGYGTEASELMINYAFNQLNYHKLFARVYDFNDASEALWKKLNFQKEGELREHTFMEGSYHDVKYYGILEGEWE